MIEMSWRSVLLALPLAVMLVGPATRAQPESAPTEPVARELAAVVSISVLRAPAPATGRSDMTAAARAGTNSAEPAAAPNAPRGSHVIGSGFIIDPAGIIVTNQHVVDRAKDILVMLHDNTLLRATLIGQSDVADIAVIKVSSDRPLPFVRFGDSDAVKIADPVLAVGNPLGLSGSVTRGIVSALNRDIRETPYDDFIQTDAAINHGNSGGPLFNDRGEVIGMNTVIVSPEPTSGSIGLGFAIPANDVKFFVDALRRPGGIRLGTLDFVIQQVTPEIADALGMNKAEGVIVGGTKEGGAASRCGIMAGDIVLRYGAMSVTNVRALARAIARTPPGSTVNLTIWRNDEPLVVMAKVEEMPADAGDRDVPPAPGPVDPGWQLAPARPAASPTTAIGQERNGVVVTDVAPDGTAAEAGIRAGDVLLQLQQTPVTDAADVARVMAAARAQQRHYVIALMRGGDGLRWFALSLE